LALCKIWISVYTSCSQLLNQYLNVSPFFSSLDPYSASAFMPSVNVGSSRATFVVLAAEKPKT
jgi:hypothetical protein